MSLSKSGFKIALVIVVYALSFGCATIGGTAQSVAIDTEPRGMQVSINSSPRSDNPLTPLALSTSRESKLKLTYHVDVFQKSVLVKCHVRYGTVFAGNIPLALMSIANPLLAGILYGSFVGIDFASGAAYECPFLLRHSLDVPSALEDQLIEPCHKVLLMPSEMSFDLTLNAALLDEAKAFAARSNKDCVDFVSPLTASDAMSRSSLSGVNLSELFAGKMDRKLAQLLRDTEAHQAVELKISKHTMKLMSVSFKLWDLYSGQVVSSFVKTISNEKFERLKGGVGSWVLGQSIKLVPNSIALLGSRPVLTLRQGVQVSQKPIGGASSVFGLLTATSVQHPDQFDAWGGDFQFGPSFYFDSLRNEVELQVSQNTSDQNNSIATLDPQRREFRGYALNIPIDATASLHTPAGAFRVFVGYGLGSYLPTSASSPDRSVKFFGIAHFGSDWVAYMSHNLFFQTGFHGFARSQSAIETQGPHDLYGWTSFMLGIGYYFPGSQGFIESIVSKR